MTNRRIPWESAEGNGAMGPTQTRWPSGHHQRTIWINTQPSALPLKHTQFSGYGRHGPKAVASALKSPSLFRSNSNAPRLRMLSLSRLALGLKLSSMVWTWFLRCQLWSIGSWCCRIRYGWNSLASVCFEVAAKSVLRALKFELVWRGLFKIQFIGFGPWPPVEFGGISKHVFFLSGNSSSRIYMNALGTSICARRWFRSVKVGSFGFISN